MLTPLNALGRLADGQDFLTYCEEQVFESCCDAICLSCGDIYESPLEPDARNIACEECGESQVFSAPELIQMSGL